VAVLWVTVAVNASARASFVADGPAAGEESPDAPAKEPYQNF